MIEHIVVNASPLILLCKTGLDSLLPALFPRIAIPAGVLKEIEAHSEDGVAQQVQSHAEFSIVDVAPEPLVQRWDLGLGETDVISFAYGHREYVALLDDAAAKNCCKVLGMKTLGTGAVLVLGKQKGLLPSVREALLQMRQQGMWISNSVISLLCHKAGENPQ